eukprot:387700_1
MSASLEDSHTMTHDTDQLLDCIQHRDQLLVFGYSRSTITYDIPDPIINYCLLYAFFSIDYVQDKIKQLKLKGNSCFNQNYLTERGDKYVNEDGVMHRSVDKNIDLDKNWMTAINYYTQALEHMIYKRNIKDYKPLIELRQALLLNRAKCHFKLSNIKDALIDSDNCIKICDDTNLTYKAHFTQFEIYSHLKDYNTAIKHCDIIINAPSDVVIPLKQRTRVFKRYFQQQIPN